MVFHECSVSSVIFGFRNFKLTCVRSPLQDLKLKELQGLAKSLGLVQQGTKGILTARLEQRLEEVGNNGQVPQRLVAMDLGLKNCALVALDTNKGRRPQVHEWARLDLEFPESYSPKEWALACQKNLIQRVQILRPDHIIIEQQSWRSSGRGFVIPSTILKLRAVEAMIFGLLIAQSTQTSHHWTVNSVSPNAISEYFDFDSASDESTTKTYRTKKGRSVEIVLRLLEGKTIDVSTKSLKTFKTERKKDDMADALLMGLAWHGWQQNALKESKRRGT